MIQLDLIEAIAARDAALNQVAENSGSFMERGLEAIRELPAGNYIGEEIRAELVRQGIEPHVPHAWGALIRSAMKKRFIRPNGKYRKMKSAKSHARESREYIIAGRLEWKS